MKRTLQIVVLTLGAVLYLSSLALSAEKPVIIGFEQKPGPSEQALIHGAKGIIKKTYTLIPAMAVSLPEEEIAALKKNSRVAYVEEDAIFTGVEPLASEEYDNSWGVYRIFADVAHTSGNKGAGVNVAVLDTGIDPTHPDLDDNFAGGINFVQKGNGSVDPLDYIDDSTLSHGTHVAGIIAAEENGEGVIGVAPEASLYAVRVLDGAGFSSLSWIISGIEWAVANNMDIVNMSIQGGDYESLQAACDAADAAGVLLVAAGGNYQSGTGPVKYPAAYDSVIAVTATDVSDMEAWFDPQGPEVELAAPGVDILSACNLANPDCASNGGYRVLSGTSQAAPHVAGTAALLVNSVGDLNEDGIIDNKDVRQALQMSATDLGLAGRDEVFGYGLVNAASASFDTDFSFTITKTSGAPHCDSETVLLADAPYEIHLANNNLSRVDIDVFEGTSLVRELSSSYNFNKNSPQEVMFTLDATGKRYDVQFTSYGKPGNSMNIMINRQEN